MFTKILGVLRYFALIATIWLTVHFYRYGANTPGESEMYFILTKLSFFVGILATIIIFSLHNILVKIDDFRIEQ